MAIGTAYPTMIGRIRKLARKTLFAVAICAIPQTVLGEDFIVTNTDDSGPGSLRDAIVRTNFNDGETHRILFDIPGDIVHLIVPQSPLPTIESEGLLIDGYSQPGTAPNSLEEGDNAVILIQLDGSDAGDPANGISICAAAVEVRGLSITGFSDMGVGLGVTSDDMLCSQAAADQADHAVVDGNFIGLEADGFTVAGNRFGVFSSQNASVRIGGFAPAERNLVSGNALDGILFLNAPAIGATIVGNYIGPDASGLSSQPGNGRDGVAAGSNAAEMFVSRNRIAGNRNGILIQAGADRTRLVRNVIRDNRALAIDLVAQGFGPDGVTPNDVDDTDEGGNDLLNFPLLDQVERNGNLLRVTGSYDRPASAEPQAFAFEWFASSACDESGHGESEIHLGESEMTFEPDDPETFSAIVAAPATLPPGSVIAATAISATGNTSEFSNCLTLPLPDPIFANGFDTD